MEIDEDRLEDAGDEQAAADAGRRRGFASTEELARNRVSEVDEVRAPRTRRAIGRERRRQKLRALDDRSARRAVRFYAAPAAGRARASGKFFSCRVLLLLVQIVHTLSRDLARHPRFGAPLDESLLRAGPDCARLEPARVRSPSMGRRSDPRDRHIESPRQREESRTFAQPYPLLKLVLEDRWGEQVRARNSSPRNIWIPGSRPIACSRPRNRPTRPSRSSIRARTRKASVSTSACGARAGPSAPPTCRQPASDAHRPLQTRQQPRARTDGGCDRSAVPVVVSAHGRGLAAGEMLTSDVRLWHTAKSRRRMDHSGEPEPRVVQIAGGDPVMMAEAAQRNVDAGAQIIDINMGCPAKKVCNKAAGSALLSDESLVRQILEAVVKAVNVPVTLKIRTGWDPDSATAWRLRAWPKDRRAGAGRAWAHARVHVSRRGGIRDHCAIKQSVVDSGFCEWRHRLTAQSEVRARTNRRRRLDDRAQRTRSAVDLSRDRLYLSGESCAPAFHRRSP